VTAVGQVQRKWGNGRFGGNCQSAGPFLGPEPVQFCEIRFFVRSRGFSLAERAVILRPFEFDSVRVLAGVQPAIL